MDSRILHECTALAFEGKLSFPETVQRLAATGVERYCADLVKLEKFIYSADGECHVEPLPLTEAPAIAAEFSAAAVKDAVRASQAGQIGYAEFLRRAMRAGVVFYDVFIAGRRVIYVGRKGDFHVERFPA